MIKGNCLCEQVKYEYTGTINEVAICHCKQCKHAQGTVFATNAPIEFKDFTFTEGLSSVKTYSSSANKNRVFCGNCGSPLYSQRSDMPDTIRLRLGTVNEGHIPEPHYEIYCDSKSTWLSDSAARPKYAQNKT